MREELYDVNHPFQPDSPYDDCTASQGYTVDEVNLSVLINQLRSLWPDIDEDDQDVEITISSLTEDDLDDELRQRIAKEV